MFQTTNQIFCVSLQSLCEHLHNIHIPWQYTIHSMKKWTRHSEEAGCAINHPKNIQKVILHAAVRFHGSISVHQNCFPSCNWILSVYPSIPFSQQIFGLGNHLVRSIPQGFWQHRLSYLQHVNYTWPIMSQEKWHVRCRTFCLPIYKGQLASGD